MKIDQYELFDEDLPLFEPIVLLEIYSPTMKIDRTRLRKGTSEIPPECQSLIDRLRQCSRTELLEELSKINTWTFGKCELYHWIGVLDIFDSILEEATQATPDNKWALYCDTNYDTSVRFKLYIFEDCCTL